MQPNKFETRLSKLAALANDRSNEHESRLAADLTAEHIIRALLVYAEHRGATIIAADCRAALEGRSDARQTCLAVFRGVWSVPAGKAALLASLAVQP